MKNHVALTLLAAFFLAALLLSYWNHFDNGFYFDDFHTIVHNGYIRDLSNIPQFFSNSDTFSNLPTNRHYRPFVTLLNSLDYAVLGKSSSWVSHISIFS